MDTTTPPAAKLPPPDINKDVAREFPIIVPVSGDNATIEDGQELPFGAIKVFWVRTLQNRWLLMKRAINNVQLSILKNEKDALGYLSQFPNLNTQRINTEYSFGDEYLILEPIPGADLYDFLEDLAKMNIKIPSFLFVRIVMHIITQLIETHARSVVHLDIKPSNIILAPVLEYEEFIKYVSSDNIPVVSAFELYQLIRDDKFKVSLIDYGVARMIGASSDGHMIGTLGYIHPWLRNDVAIPVQTRFDVFSLVRTLEYLALNVKWTAKAQVMIDEVMDYLSQVEQSCAHAMGGLEEVVVLAKGLTDIFLKHNAR